jgi:hypothetical protein
MASSDKKKANEKWEKQREALKKIQITFELMQSVDREIRIEAAETGESPSNVIRKVLGLDVNPPVRPRLGVSLSEDEILGLAKRYNVDPSDRKNLVRRATEAIQLHYKRNRREDR